MHLLMFISVCIQLQTGKLCSLFVLNEMHGIIAIWYDKGRFQPQSIYTFCSRGIVDSSIVWYTPTRKQEERSEKLLYEFHICCLAPYNWPYCLFAAHLWVKQCLELILTVAVNGTQIQGAAPSYQLAPVSSVVNLADSHERAAFVQVCIHHIMPEKVL